MAPKIRQATLTTPLQKQLTQLISEGLLKGSGPLSDIFGGFNEKQFEEGVANPAMKQFQEEILPQLQEKFIAGNQVLGSGFRRGQQKAATDLQSLLAQLKYQAQQDQVKNRQSGVNTILGKQNFENIVEPQQKSSPLSGILPAAGTAIGALVGGPAGAAIGSSIGSGAAKTIAG